MLPSHYFVPTHVYFLVVLWLKLHFPSLAAMYKVEEHLLQMPHVGSATVALYIYLFFYIIGCLADMEYQLCGLQLTCNNFSMTNNHNNSLCQSGCFCSNKHVLEDGMCIHPDTCPSKLL